LKGQKLSVPKTQRSDSRIRQMDRISQKKEAVENNPCVRCPSIGGCAFFLYIYPKYVMIRAEDFNTPVLCAVIKSISAGCNHLMFKRIAYEALQ